MSQFPRTHCLPIGSTAVGESKESTRNIYNDNSATHPNDMGLKYNGIKSSSRNQSRAPRAPPRTFEKKNEYSNHYSNQNKYNKYRKNRIWGTIQPKSIWKQ